jgi:ubiquinone/menaquinone biosynthesis C-methylase UbiE
MEPLRKPFQGVYNILRFNWHSYVLAAALALTLTLLSHLLPLAYNVITGTIIFMVILTTLISLGVSLYVYDLSGLYKLDWVDEVTVSNGKIINVNAGFDETSVLLQQKYPEANITAYDFYDPLKHTEVSIKRARKAYTPFEGTVRIDTSAIPLANDDVDNIFLIFSAHEIRNESERGIFFNEIKRVLKPGGKVILMEHLRNGPNFLAYNWGFFHFISKSLWYKTFNRAGLRLCAEEKFTPFITKFILEK